MRALSSKSSTSSHLTPPSLAPLFAPSDIHPAASLSLRASARAPDVSLLRCALTMDLSLSSDLTHICPSCSEPSNSIDTGLRVGVVARGVSSLEEVAVDDREVKRPPLVRVQGPQRRDRRLGSRLQTASVQTTLAVDKDSDTK
eukprot:CAMPEP_0114160630 /NCGR_PEP_ID=MMETSP0043_2-20121206/28463_1 /TAXON_ID=464988 /ORGANISM="Hemiselmis andersenii, Strain CCMP644" /LENGTH=142 /DNA_ID=CAMNT_0001256689 /DNA_START=173 /DNA_END=597 /DNA_ORIENTATION=-